MGKIVQLNDLLANKIAAGEVVERPASVVKELVENSIDANATVIEIDIEEGGLTKIRIADNGDGMERDDCHLCLSRHATSKIKSENDLFRIRSLGFRGEAIPSIASVSHFQLTSSTGGEATRLNVVGGRVAEEATVAFRKGTEIVISHLFFNTPARLKYLKSVTTEFGQIVDVINRLALSYPNVSFRLTHNGKRTFYSPGSGDVRQVLAAIYGVPIAQKMKETVVETTDFTIRVYAAQPEVNRASRNYMSLTVNGRFIRNNAINRAVLDGYHTFLPIGRYPIVYVALEMDPILVDVNVHPTKQEVRFSKEGLLFETVRDAVLSIWKQTVLIPTIERPVEQVKEVTEQVKIDWSAPVTYEAPPIVQTSPPVVREERAVVEPVVEDAWEDAFEEVEVVAVQEEPRRAFPSLSYIGQLHGTYLLCQDETGFFMIDQHAAQERLKYEHFRRKLADVTNEQQQLLLPLTLTYTVAEKLVIDERLPLLAEWGVHLEPFGEQTYIVRSHPTWLTPGEETELIEMMIHQVATTKQVNVEKLREETAIMMSCKASIKANRHLRGDEVERLLRDLSEAEDPFTCPHGRPVVIQFTTYEIEKWFKRVM